MRKEVLFGAAYYYEYMPYDRLDQDVRMMQEAGINVVRIAESTWSTLEPQDGVFDFTHIDRVLNAMEQANISVIVGTPTYAVPTWLVREYPDETSMARTSTVRTSTAPGRIWILPMRIICSMRSGLSGFY